MSSAIDSLATASQPRGPARKQALWIGLHQVRLLRAWLFVGDVIALAAAFVLAYWIRFGLQLTTAPQVVPPAGFYPVVISSLLLLFPTLFAFYSLYHSDVLLSDTNEYARLFNACTVSTMTVVLADFLLPMFNVSRAWLLSSWLLAVTFTILARFLTRRLLRTLRARGYLRTRTLIVGGYDEAKPLVERLSSDPGSGYHVVGLVTRGRDPHPRNEAPNGSHLPLLGCLSDLRALILELEATEVIVAGSALGRDELIALYEAIQPLERVTMRMSSALHDIVATGVNVKTVAGAPLLTLGRLRLTASQALAKALIEYMIAAVGLLILFPLLVVIACAIKMSSRGPILYRRRVVGLGGRTFNALKFRTMCLDADDVLRRNRGLDSEWNRRGKLRHDPRVTSVGRYLRKYSLDEVPQLWNVIRGEMSLIGPRMITSDELAKYGLYKAGLLTVKPGITGLWQVSGRSDLAYGDRVKLDMHYIREYSIWLDLRILYLTPRAVLSGRGAY